MTSGKPRSRPASGSGQPNRPPARAGATRPARSAPTPAPPPFPSALLGAGLIIGLYAMVPALFTGGIHLRRSVEVVDHVVPGVVVLGLVLLAIVRRAQPDTLMLVAGVGIALAGFWMAATHVGLASQAFNHQASTGGALYHCSTAVVVGALGITWVWRYRTAGTASEQRTAPARRF
jgi:hypothetical protein